MNKYISISNNDNSYINNKNFSFTTNISPIIIKKKCKLALTDISYRNKIKKNLGKFEILIKRTSKSDDDDYTLFMKNFRDNLSIIIDKIDVKFNKLKDQTRFVRTLFENISPDYEELKELLISLKDEFLKIDNLDKII